MFAVAHVELSSVLQVVRFAPHAARTASLSYVKTAVVLSTLRRSIAPFMWYVSFVPVIAPPLTSASAWHTAQSAFDRVPPMVPPLPTWCDSPPKSASTARRDPWVDVPWQLRQSGPPPCPANLAA